MSEQMMKNNYEVYSDHSRNEMLKYVPSDAKKILDVGCSTGNFGKLIKSEQTSEIWGVEIDPDAAEIASQRIDNVICGAFNSELELPENNFDCIIFNDVLEHMIDPYAALRYAKKLLSVDGKIVASIPNVRFFENIWLLIVNKSWEYLDSGILDRTHLRFFTKKSIAMMFEQQGYKIELLEGINEIGMTAPHLARKFRILHKLTLRNIEDMRWTQFAVVAGIDRNKS